MQQQQVLTGRIRVAIHTPDAIIRAGLASCLQQDRRLSLVETARTQEADVIVLAVETAGATMLETLRSLSDQPTARFLVIVDKQWDAEISAAVDRGVRAVLWRASFSPAVFVRTLLAVADGHGSLPPSLQGQLIDQVQWTQREVLEPRGLTTSGITARELDVLRLVSEGRELTEIAQKLSYSERTVKNVLYGVMKRLQFRNRAHAVSYAIRSGLI